jgi:hypothetical protein
MRSTYRTLAAFHAAYAIVQMVGGLAFGAVFGLFGALPIAVEPGKGESWAIGAAFIGIGGLVGLIVAALALPGLLCAVGLWRGRGWARILALLSCWQLVFQLPVGTALAIWTAVVVAKQTPGPWWEDVPAD